jgi:hypothetical protein
METKSLPQVYEGYLHYRIEANKKPYLALFSSPDMDGWTYLHHISVPIVWPADYDPIAIFIQQKEAIRKSILDNYNSMDQRINDELKRFLASENDPKDI